MSSYATGAFLAREACTRRYKLGDYDTVGHVMNMFVGCGVAPVDLHFVVASLCCNRRMFSNGNRMVAGLLVCL